MVSNIAIDPDTGRPYVLEGARPVKPPFTNLL